MPVCDVRLLLDCAWFFEGLSLEDSYSSVEDEKWAVWTHKLMRFTNLGNEDDCNSPSYWNIFLRNGMKGWTLEWGIGCPDAQDVRDEALQGYWGRSLWRCYRVYWLSKSCLFRDFWWCGSKRDSYWFLLWSTMFLILMCRRQRPSSLLLGFGNWIVGWVEIQVLHRTLCRYKTLYGTRKLCPMLKFNHFSYMLFHYENLIRNYY